MQTVSIIGVGLIGASFGLALRKAGFEGSIRGVSSESSIQTGIDVGAIDAGATFAEAAASSDLIYLSQPIEQILSALKHLGPILSRECLVTDAGSTKAIIVKTALEHLSGEQFVGGHPMAGKEQRGAAAADGELFRGRPYVLTPTSKSARLDIFRSWLERIGARVVEMDPERHDRTVALTSHLPQLVSTALASTLAHRSDLEVAEVFGPGLLDMTRLALSAPEVWMSVLRTNSGPVQDALKSLETELQEIRVRLQRGEIADIFSQAQEFAAKIRKISYTI